MDGIVGDFFRLGRRLRPATEEFAVANFPRLIQRLLQNRLTIVNEQSIGNVGIVQCYTNIKHEHWVILKSDFDLCKNISSSVSLKTFPSDTDQIILDRIRAHIRVAFAGNGTPINSSPGNVVSKEKSHG